MSAYGRQAVTALAALALAAALGWWWRTYGEVVSYGYLSWTEAGRCLVSDNDICSLARALCLGAHPRTFVAYASVAFWIALALLSAALWLRAPAARKA
jgi:hypothetical protein